MSGAHPPAAPSLYERMAEDSPAEDGFDWMLSDPSFLRDAAEQDFARNGVPLPEDPKARDFVLEAPMSLLRLGILSMRAYEKPKPVGRPAHPPRRSLILYAAWSAERRKGHGPKAACRRAAKRLGRPITADMVEKAPAAVLRTVHDLTGGLAWCKPAAAPSEVSQDALGFVAAVVIFLGRRMDALAPPRGK